MEVHENPNNETTLGIMYGVFYDIRNLPNRQDYGFIREEDDYVHDRIRYDRYARSLDITTNTDPDKALEASLLHFLGPNTYHIVLRSLTDSTLAAVETVRDAPGYLQGIISGLQLYNIPLSEVLLKSPYNRTNFYEIEGYCQINITTSSNIISCID